MPEVKLVPAMTPLDVEVGKVQTKLFKECENESKGKAQSICLIEKSR